MIIKRGSEGEKWGVIAQEFFWAAQQKYRNSKGSWIWRRDRFWLFNVYTMITILTEGGLEFYVYEMDREQDYLRIMPAYVSKLYAMKSTETANPTTKISCDILWHHGMDFSLAIITL